VTRKLTRASACFHIQETLAWIECRQLNQLLLAVVLVELAVLVSSLLSSQTGSMTDLTASQCIGSSQQAKAVASQVGLAVSNLPSTHKPNSFATSLLLAKLIIIIEVIFAYLIRLNKLIQLITKNMRYHSPTSKLTIAFTDSPPAIGSSALTALTCLFEIVTRYSLLLLTLVGTKLGPRTGTGSLI
jgi:hypothetical protein